jgi:hypothetical protein
MTKEERKEYMRKYRAEHKEQIKTSAERRNIAKFKRELDHTEVIGNGLRAYMKDGTTFDFIQPFV